MKRILIPLLALVLLLAGTSVLAEGNHAVTLELNTAKLQVYAAGDPYLARFGAGAEQPEENALPVLLLPEKKSLQLQVTVKPKSVKNRKVTLSAADGEIVSVKGNAVTGLKLGTTVLTVASQEDPAVTLQYLVLVYRPVTRISLAVSEKSVAAGQTVSVTPSFLPADATVQEIVWSSANEQIAVVDENGNVTGVNRGNARITASSADGGNIRSNISIQVIRNAEEILLDKQEITVDIGRTGVLKATVLPKNADNKKVVWSSSDEAVAVVSPQGRITGVALGECEIICASQADGTVQSRAVVHVQQPVKGIAFGAVPAIYVGETGRLSWTVSPSDATNPAVRLTSANEKILTVSDDGSVTGIAAGETYVTAVSTDGSNRQAKVRVRVLQHLTGVHMRRKTAYIDVGQTSSAGAVFEPEKNTNHNMTWESADPSVATVYGEEKQPGKAMITGVRKGETVVTGTTEDGGFQASIKVKIGDWENSLKWVEGKFDARGNLQFRLKNVSDLNLSNITVEIEFYDFDGKPQKGLNTKNGSNVVQAVYSGTLAPGATTKESQWKLFHFDKQLANTEGFAAIVVRITEFRINNDWEKVIRKNHRPKTKYDPHKVLR